MRREAFIAPFLELQIAEEIRALQTSGGPARVSVAGCMDDQKAHLIHALTEGSGVRFIITDSEQRARAVVSACAFFEDSVLYFPAKDMLFYHSDIRGSALTKERMRVYEALRNEENPVIVTTGDALLNRLVPPRQINDNVLCFHPGDEIDLDRLRVRLVAMGYEYNVQAEQPGQFAVRGHILDIFGLTRERPVRIEMWGDEIDRIQSFHPETQRSLETLDEAVIFPAAELVLDREQTRAGLRRLQKEAETLQEQLRENMQTEEAARVRKSMRILSEEIGDGGHTDAAEAYLPYFIGAKETVCLLDYAENASVFIDEPSRTMELCDNAYKEFADAASERIKKGYMLDGQRRLLFSSGEIRRKLNARGFTAVSTMDRVRVPGLTADADFHLKVRPVNAYQGNFDLLKKDLSSYKKENYRVILLARSAQRAGELARDLTDLGITAFATEEHTRLVQPGETMVIPGNLAGGFDYPDIRFAVLSETDIFGKRRRKKDRGLRQKKTASDFSEWSVGDYVVHENHGIGIYRGIEKIEVNHIIKDYMKIEYAAGSTLYVLATQTDVVQKYADSDAKRPKIHRLGGNEWQKTRSTVRHAVSEVAQNLVELYAQRQNHPGYSYGPDTVWQKEFEEAFPYEETQDQLRAIEETKADMESGRIMERLICGDVGFGKTEVAIRAAFKAVQENKQVAYLVPTTILAQQHYDTFLQRMKDYPISIELLCRFRTDAQQKQSIERLKKGQADIVIGTHRLLSKDVAFKDLGLLIVDEEQRFGVSHKERIKEMKKDVDVMTLTATPIPRTLHMSLSGIRDMSVLTEPPQDRMPIQTYIIEYDEEMIREAIRRELNRGGQVYYVFNQIRQIAEMTARLSRLLPDARIRYAHGRMSETRLEEIMYQFIHGEIDVLVSTTIIETGLDIPNVNTMIIHDADRYGLAQLYQLRGRVGRSNRTAYAFLTYRRDKILTEVAQKRLSAIRDFSDLGSGMKIALRDLEIRGAGNLLGEAQHGHLEAVGYDYYCKMLNEAVLRQKGELKQEHFETVLEIDADAYIPEGYITDEVQKLDIYRRISGIACEEDYDEMLDELIDRFGDPPRAVQSLLRVALLKARAHAAYITEISQKGDRVEFCLYEKAPIDAQGIPALIRRYHPYLTFRADPKKPMFVWDKRGRAIETTEVIEKVAAACLDLLRSDEA